MSMEGFFKAIVKDNRDKTGNGRVRLYIPAFGGDPTDENIWYTASPVSPYAGQTDPYGNTKGGKQEVQSQDSYGVWNNSYHPDNEVIVSFVDGKPNSPVIVGSVFGQNMTSAIAGYPSNKSTNGKVGGVNPPTVEYNKRDEDINPRSPERPRRELLTSRLWQQGLFKDFLRGQMDTSPMRDLVPQFQSFKTPGGAIFAMDDGKVGQGGAGTGSQVAAQGGSSPYMRMRTRGGAQFMMNSNCGFIYMNSKSGSSWAQIANNGIQFYTAGDLNTRAQAGYNQRSDGTHNIEVLGDMNIRSVGAVGIETDAGFHNKTEANYSVTTAGDHSIKSVGDQKYDSGSDYNENAGGNIYEDAGGTVLSNTGAALSAESALVIGQSTAIDRSLTMDPNTTVSEGLSAAGPTTAAGGSTTIPQGDFVTHEPWANQPGACGKPASGSEEGTGEDTETQPNGDGTEEEVPVEDSPQGPTDAGPGDVVEDMDRAHVVGEFGEDRGSHAHGGIDIVYEGGGLINGANANAAQAGTVTSVGTMGGYGKTVQITHGNGLVTQYSHLSGYNVQVGQQVGAGTPIGSVGSTGHSQGPHLHFETLVNGTRVNPTSIYPQLGNLPRR